MQNMFDSLMLYILNRYIKVFLVAPGNQAVGGGSTATLKLNTTGSCKAQIYMRTRLDC